MPCQRREDVKPNLMPVKELTNLVFLADRDIARHLLPVPGNKLSHEAKSAKRSSAWTWEVPKKSRHTTT